MNIIDLYIGMHIFDEDKKIHVIEQIDGKHNTITCSDGFTTTPGRIQIVGFQPYLKTDEFGHKSFCIDTEEGTLSASVDTPLETNYTAMYIGYAPQDEATAYKDIACVRTSHSKDELEVNVWENDDDPSYCLSLNIPDICPKIDYN